jgi:hypothetical protein
MKEIVVIHRGKAPSPSPKMTKQQWKEVVSIFNINQYETNKTYKLHKQHIVEMGVEIYYELLDTMNRGKN